MSYTRKQDPFSHENCCHSNFFQIFNSDLHSSELQGCTVSHLKVLTIFEWYTYYLGKSVVGFLRSNASIQSYPHLRCGYLLSVCVCKQKLMTVHVG